MLVFIEGFGLVGFEGLRRMFLTPEGSLVFQYNDGGKLEINDQEVARRKYEEITENIAYQEKMETKHRRSHAIIEALAADQSMRRQKANPRQR